MDFLSGRVKGLGFERESDCDVATKASVDEASVIGRDCSVKPGAVIRNSVLGPGAHVEEKAVVENSVIWGHTRIAASAEVRGAVIGRGCHIGRSVTISPGAVLGDKASLPDYTRV